jgi:pSer/pThr/pTyr-binding forkhead associated (FHA) protein
MSGPVVLALRLLLTLCLYAFLAWAFINLWRDIKIQGALLTTHNVPPLSLTILRDGFDPQVRQFVRTEVTIGRNPACECPVEDETISGRHARLSYHHNQWWLEDLNSTNGTMLNQDRVTLPTVVISGDEFSCGDTHVSISLPGELLTLPTKTNLKKVR